MDLSSVYSQQNLTDFFSNSFLPEDFTPQNQEIELDFSSNHYKKVTYLGESSSLDLSVYEIKHSSEHDARVSLSRDSFKLISRYTHNNALILFVPENSQQYRLSLVTIQSKLDEKGIKIEREYSNPKRFSFILGEGAKIHTPNQSLIKPGRVKDIGDLMNRFNVEVVNKEFYSQISEYFTKLVGGKRKIGTRFKEFDRMLSLPSAGSDDDQLYKEFAVRLIGRTIFCWFLKKKSSANGLTLIPEEVLSLKAAKSNNNYYHSVLEPLFFEILNTKHNNRLEKYSITPFDSIPFLNGGLFEPHYNDYYKLDNLKNTSIYTNALKIPDGWWIEFIEILERYNFTIDENISIDVDLSVDPEMLGRIFENLLAEINPETDKSAQKATGSFYTPRDVVDYMVDSALIQHLNARTKITKDRLRLLLDIANESTITSEVENEIIIGVLNDLKVLDPACGSGAFTMGFLHKILILLEKIDPNSTKWLEKQLEKVPDLLRDDFRKSLKTKTISYKHKLGIIKESIYGIDIQPIAIEISKLRFFLSLIVDEVVDDKEINRGIKPLPNLEFKFVCANTIVNAPTDEYIENKAQNNLIEIESLSERYFTEYDIDEKHNIIEQIEKNIEEIITWNRNVINQYITQIKKERNSSSVTRIKQLEKSQQKYISALTKWESLSNLFVNKPVDFFNIKYLFPEVKSKFDIVIGNPPYGVSIRDTYRSDVVENLGKVPDYEIYYFFIEVAKNLLKDSGILCYIIPNTILFNVYAKKYRTQIFNSWSVNEIIDCTQFDLFEQATVRNIILQFEKNTKNEIVGYRNTSNVLSFQEFLNRPIEKIHKLKLLENNSNWGLAFKLNPEILNVVTEIRKNSLPLSDYYNEISQGLIAYDKYQGQDEYTIQNRIYHHNKYQEGLKNWMWGSDVNRYSVKWNGEEYIDYCDGIANPRESKFFNRPRILVREITNPSIFAGYTEEESYNDPAIINILIDNKYQYEIVLGILNSRLASFYHFNSSPKATKGAFPKILVDDINNFPVPKTENEFLSERLIHIVKERIHLNKLDEKDKRTVKLDNIIDIIVYRLYELNFNDIKIIDPNIEEILSEKDYSNNSFIDTMIQII